MNCLKIARHIVLMLIAAALFLPAAARADVVLLQEDFESYAPGSNLVGQNGWASLDPATPGPIYINAGAGLSTQVAPGHPDPGTKNQAAVTKALSGSLSATGKTILSFDAYAFSPSHNYLVELVTGGSNPEYGWSYSGPLDPNCSGGWHLYATGSGAGNCFNGPEATENPVTLEIVIDADAGTYFGRVSDVSGLLYQSSDFAISAAQIAGIDGVRIYFDYRGAPYGQDGEFDNILVVTGVPEPAALGLMLAGILPYAVRRRRAKTARGGK